MQNNNPLTEITAIVLAVLLVIAATVLVYVGKIDFTQATVVYGLAATIYGGNLALKAPSPSQQANMQQIISDLTAAMGVLFQHTHPAPQASPIVAPAAPAPAPQVVQQQPFPQNTGRFPVPQ